MSPFLVRLRVLVGLVVAAVLSGAGCRQHSGRQAAHELAPHASRASPASSTSTDRQRRLALVPLPVREKGGSLAPVDSLIDQLQRRAGAAPEQVEVWLLLGQAWARKAREISDPGFYLQAEACAEVALEPEPAPALALDLMALVRLSDHRFADAALLARRVLATQPDHPQAWGTLSDALLELGDYRGAAEAAQRMVDLKPNLAS